MLQNPLIALHILPKINKISPKGQFFVKSGHTEQRVGKRKRERERENGVLQFSTYTEINM